MTEIRINEAKRVIEVTKGFYKEASKFGTEEYKMLKEARNDFPTFKVVTRSAGKNRDGFKGLTFDYMEKYIKEHREIEIANKETGEKSKRDLLVEFYEKCGKDANGKKVDFSKTESYGTIKKWFLEVYPIFEEYRQKNLKKSA
ncbi:MAG: hypothetical protein SOS24_04920 [Clostridia bacterium]|nr:hypothetical protein [Clostridia bacterium]